MARIAKRVTVRAATKRARPKSRARTAAGGAARTGRPKERGRRSAAGKSAPAAKPALRVGDAAVAAKTGKTWPQWFKVLDRAGAAAWAHPAIARWLHEQQGLSGWWSQMVTVGYEQARLGRAPHEKPGGFEIGASKTVAVPVSALFAAWHDPRKRGRWLADPLTVTKATPGKSLRGQWADGTRISVEFLVKGAGKSLVAVQHMKLKDAQAASRMKAYWAAALARLKGDVEGRR